MFMHIMFYVLAVIAGLVGGVGDGLLNRGAKHGGMFWWAFGGFACCNIALTLFFIMLSSGNYLSQSGAVFDVANGLVILCMGWFIFHEKLSLMSWFGIVVIFSGLMLTEIGS
jgi:drug/metabolite transporter (DMT)-like permease